MAKLVELGHLQPTDLLWREGFPDWRPAMVVFPPHSKPVSTSPRGARQVPRDSWAPARSAARSGPADMASYSEEDADERAPGRWRRAVVLLVLAVALAGAGGAAYLYRAELAGIVTSLSAPSGAMAIADRKSLETPPLLGFREGPIDAIDAKLQATALWRVIKREFPDWYAKRIDEAAALARDKKDDAVIGQFVARKLVELRRQNRANGLSATLPALKTVAAAYLGSLERLRRHSPEACGGFIRQGEAEPLIVALLQGSEHTAHLQAQLTAVFEAIAEGRQMPRVHPRASQEQHQMLATELAKRGWTQDDFRLLSSDQALAKAPPEKVCQLVYDFFAAQLALPDPDAQQRLLVDSLRPVFAG